MPTIKDVAKLAGVSISTVSNVINDSKHVSEELRTIVNQAIDTLGYKTDLVARSMRKNKTNTLGIIFVSMNTFTLQVMNGIRSSASKANVQLIFYTTDFNLEKEKLYLDMLVGSKVDGIIMTSCAPVDDEKYFRYLAGLEIAGKRIPVVSLERNLTQFGIHSVHVDNVNGGRMATEHLIQNGCRHIALITGPKEAEAVKDRMTGHRQCLEAYGLPFEPGLVGLGDYTPISGYLTMRHLIANGDAFDGLFAFNDQMAIGALRALMDYNVSVPADVKIIGFDNTFVSTLVTPSLSTVNTPQYRMGVSSTQLVLKLSESDPDQVERSCEIPINVIPRATTGLGDNNPWELEHW